MNPTLTTLIPPAAEARATPGVRTRRPQTVPGHVALVNGAARETAALASVISAAIEHGVECLSLCFAENAVAEFLRNGGEAFVRDGVHVTVQDGCSAELRELSARLPALPARESLLRLHLLVDVSGELEVSQALQRLAWKVQRGELAPDALTREALERELDTDGLPPVDLLLHAANAPRLSRTLLWKAAYAELFFSATPWSRFGREDFRQALADYAQRRRTFGGLK